MKETLSKILQVVNEKSPTKSCLIAIDGCGGSGKTTIAAALHALNPEIVVVHMDEFYKPSWARCRSDGDKNVNLDWQRLCSEVIEPLVNSQPAIYSPYDWHQDGLSPAKKSIPANSTVIVEGVMTLRSELRRYFDLRIWVDCARDERLRRGLERDGESMRRVWVDEWMPSEDLYVEKHHPNAAADIKIDTAIEFVDFCQTTFEQRLATRGIILSDKQDILLMKMRNPNTATEFWVAPGGGIEGNETPEEALQREFREELGALHFSIGREIWRRVHRFEWGGRFIEQRERYYLVEAHYKFTPVASGMDDDFELNAFRGFQWWTLDAIAASNERFTPRNLAGYLRQLLTDSDDTVRQIGV